MDPITGKCPEPPKCQISLSGFPAEVEPGKEVKNLRADVYCDGVLTAKGVVLTATVDKTSGGHEGTHNPDRPVGSLSPSSGNSSLPFSFGAPAPAGTHTVTAKCTDDSCGAAEGNVKVWVSLQPLLTDPNYVLIKPNADQNHPSNHHVTGTTQQKISGLAADYHKRFPIDPLLHLNDASLVWGGLFDLAANWSGQPYGHSTHRKGTDIDVQAHEFYHDPKKSIPSYNYVDFMRIASKHGCNAQIHSGATQNEHFHLYCADR